MRKKMNPEVKAKWVAALRSGEYKQGKGRMRVTEYNTFGTKGEAYCCLGVLSKLYADEHGLGFEAVDSGACSFPTKAVQRWCGMSGALMFEDTDTPLFCKIAARNDGDYAGEEAWSFEKTADWIEANL